MSYPPPPPPDQYGGYPPPNPHHGPPTENYGLGPGPGYDRRPPRRSNKPILIVIAAVAVMLCAGSVTAVVLATKWAAGEAEDAAGKVAEPFKGVTEAPLVPTTLPSLPTQAPGLPGLPTDLPDLPDVQLPKFGSGRDVKVVYEVTGEGPAEIVYMGPDGPARAHNAKLPWKISVTLTTPNVISLVARRDLATVGTVKCQASADGKAVATFTRKAERATATCVKVLLS